MYQIIYANTCRILHKCFSSTLIFIHKKWIKSQVLTTAVLGRRKICSFQLPFCTYCAPSEISSYPQMPSCSY